MIPADFSVEKSFFFYRRIFPPVMDKNPSVIECILGWFIFVFSLKRKSLSRLFHRRRSTASNPFAAPPIWYAARLSRLSLKPPSLLIPISPVSQPQPHRSPAPPSPESHHRPPTASSLSLSLSRSQPSPSTHRDWKGTLTVLFSLDLSFIYSSEVLLDSPWEFLILLCIILL